MASAGGGEEGLENLEDGKGGGGGRIREDDISPL